MAHEFKIGDLVMADFSKYGNKDLRALGPVIGETKTLWKCKDYSFSKTSGNTLKGYSDIWHHVCAMPYNDEVFRKNHAAICLDKEYDKAVRKASNLMTDSEKIAFINWVEENL